VTTMVAGTTSTRKYLRTAELAARWGTTPAAVAQLRYRGLGPAYVRLPNVGIRYQLDAVEAYEQEAEGAGTVRHVGTGERRPTAAHRATTTR